MADQLSDIFQTALTDASIGAAGGVFFGGPVGATIGGVGGAVAGTARGALSYARSNSIAKRRFELGLQDLLFQEGLKSNEAEGISLLADAFASPSADKMLANQNKLFATLDLQRMLRSEEASLGQLAVRSMPSAAEIIAATTIRGAL